MPYDSDKDKCLKVVGITSPDTNTGIEVSLWSYNNGKPKISLIRKGARKNGETWTSSIGRISEEELDLLLPLLQEAQRVLSEKDF